MKHKAYSERELAEVVPRVKETILESAGDETLVDVLGDVRTVERGLASLRQEMSAELDDFVYGERWQMVRNRQAKRSYNTPQIVNKFANAMKVSMFEAIIYLMKEGALKFSWQWLSLQRAAANQDVTLVTANHEIEEGDEEDMGVVWSWTTPRYERIEDPEKGKR